MSDLNSEMNFAVASLLARHFPQTEKEIKKLHDLTRSWDDTITMLELAAAQGRDPIQIWREIPIAKTI